ncbi:MAG: ASKHA domain-containing protein [Candidatus Aminicenantes bacterium]|jgi:uncharacterized 2Fe-2S/4Fe-4S cluster protein (DUF4445 family)
MTDKETVNVRFLPFETEISVGEGSTLLDALKKANLPIKSSCGGVGTCRECLMRIVEGDIAETTSAGLPADIVSQGFVLACQAKIKDSLTVQLPHFEEISIQSVTESDYFNQNKERISGVYEITPWVKKFPLILNPPSLENNYSDLKRIEIQLKKEGIPAGWRCGYSVLQKLARTVRQDPDRIDCVLSSWGQERTIIDISPASAGRKTLGIACDIGTSTVALHLADLDDGEILSTASSYNQQIKCGEDIISRINYAFKRERLEELHKLVIKTINHLIKKTIKDAGVTASDIACGSFSGNTTMTHLFLGCDPRYIREEPYVPTFNRVPIVCAGDLGLDMNREAPVICAPAVGSYVGGDITAGLLATPILRDTEHIFLFIDAGTNGELVVGNSDWLVTCACSAGPAFEGSGIKCGMPASEGAMESLTIKGQEEVAFQTINGSKPKGLCGSGLVDLLAELFTHECINRSGVFIEDNIGTRLVDTEDGPAYLIAGGEDTYWGKDIVITENDIASLIRTKGAVFSACALLLKNVGLDFDSIENVFLAGGFGRHLDVENAVRIGLLPDLQRDKFQYIGNSSLLGALLILFSENNKKKVEELAGKMTYVELNTEPRYMNEYTGALFLPHTEMELFPSVSELFLSKKNLNKG